MTHQDHGANWGRRKLGAAQTGGGANWGRRKPGQTVYNPPGIRHAMRANATPFLALWCLPV